MKEKIIKSKFKVGEMVRIKQVAINDDKKKIAHIPVSEWNVDETYIIKELGLYGPCGGPNRYFILVHGSSQFTDPKYFEKVNVNNIVTSKVKKAKFQEIKIDGIEYILVPKRYSMQ